MIVRFGEEAQSELDRCILRAADHPQLYRMRLAGCRRTNLRIFPYYVPFIVRERTFWVLAVAHTARQPLYWISRRDQIV